MLGGAQQPLDGIAAPLSSLPLAAGKATGGKGGSGVGSAVDAILRRLSGRPSEEEEEVLKRSSSATAATPALPGSREMRASSSSSPSSRSWIRRLLNLDREALLAEEREALGKILAFLEVSGMYSLRWKGFVP